MDYKLAFKVLRIDVTQNQKEIIAAYRKLLPGCNPEDNADEFMKLREAFEVATEYAKNADYEEKMESDEAGEFLNSVENLYSDYARRINEEEWRSVLDCPFCVSLETSDIARDKQENGNDYEEDNAELLEKFISAKRLEGRSDGTLNYYQFTIEKMFEDIGKNIRAITTEDLRDYLSRYYTEKEVSKVTIDNIRRNLSSFFT